MSESSNKSVSFGIVRRMSAPAPKSAGLALRSVKADTDSASAVLYDLRGYEAVKQSIAAYRLQNSGAVSYKTRGRSLELNVKSAALGPESAPEPARLQDAPAYGGKEEPRRSNAAHMLLALLREFSFNTEDVLDVMEFAERCLSEGAHPALRLRRMELSAELFSAELSADIVDGSTPGAIYSYLDPVCTKCGMGIIKERGEELSESDENRDI